MTERPASPGPRLVLRHLVFLGTCVVLAILFRRLLASVISLGLVDDRYTPSLAVPAITIALVWFDRSRIFKQVRYSWAWGVGTGVSAAILLTFAALLPDPSAAYVLSIRIFALLLFCAAAFISNYGSRAARAAVFPLGLLILAIPLPATILAQAVLGLQRASAEVSYRLFKMLGVPIFREGPYRFLLPGVSIEVAQECSGIRSSLSLFISGTVAGYLLLTSAWSRTLFSLATIPIVIFKNALRIVTIAVLGVYADPAFLHGTFHRHSGLPFSLVAFALLGPILFTLMRLERRSPRQSLNLTEASARTAV